MIIQILKNDNNLIKKISNNYNTKINNTINYLDKENRIL